jgi:hypothetical protein
VTTCRRSCWNGGVGLVNKKSVSGKENVSGKRVCSARETTLLISLGGSSVLGVTAPRFRLSFPAYVFSSRLCFYLLRISAFNLRIIAKRLSDGSAPVITSIRSPRCMAIVRSVRLGSESFSAVGAFGSLIVFPASR